MKKITLVLFAICILCAVSKAEAVVLLQEDFNEAPILSGFPPFNPGVPVTPDADNDWYAARFQGTGVTSASIAGDVGRSAWPPFDLDLSAHGWATDDAGMLIGLSTVGYTDVVWEFDWLTALLESNDDLMAGYYIGDITGFNNRTKDLRDVSGDPASRSNWVWTTLGRTNDWTHASIALPENTENLWIAYWLDNGDSDFGKFDNILISGEENVIPEPATLVLLSSGLFGVFLRRRKV